MSILYFDCFSGASGDMILGALIDAGAPPGDIRAAVGALGIGGWSLEVNEVKRGALRALRAEVTVDEPEPSRKYPETVAIIERASLHQRVTTRAQDIFRMMAQAEATVHGVAIEDAHLHEIGATDALVDIVGVSAGLEHFRPDSIACSPIATGTGSVPTAHGDMPLPAPAVSELLKGVPTYGLGTEELITPTGAAILRATCDTFGELPPMKLEQVGYGAGARNTERANILRVLVGAPTDDRAALSWLIDTNIDDSTPESLAYVVERLLVAGADDAWTTPIIMKKGRPAVTLSVLCGPADRDRFEEIVFTETSTLGTRSTQVTKRALARESITVDVGGNEVRVTLARLGSRVVTVAPEYEDARAAARSMGKPLKEVFALAVEASQAQIS